ncbi:uncharacterized protein LOC135491231 [Lineus longissimus]|uniref:uncharacterized protein LOC135491231 n=1 Tax=Lineus longissimus TaxID=88925 RepID=UPI00315D09B0
MKMKIPISRTLEFYHFDGKNPRKMLCVGHLSLLILCNAFCAATVFGASQPSEESIERGREAYQRALRESKSRIPEYGQCWKNALSQLEEGCQQLTDETQHTLAISFLNCFLLSTGKESLICHKPHYMDCTRDFDNSLIQLHNNYFIHTQNMCSFLQLQIWHDKTEDTISRLATASSDTAKRLLESSEQQEVLLKRQNESLKNQDKILKSGDQLERVLESSTSGVKAIFDEYKKTTKEQRLLITDVFDRVSSLQNLVLGEFTSLYSLIFYVLSIAISYLITSTPRTSGARFWLFLLMTADIFVERMIVSWCGLDSHISVNDTNSILYERLWLCRKMFWFAAVALLAKFGYTYKDLNKINNQHLVEIRQQIYEIRRSVDSGIAVGLPYRPQKESEMMLCDHGEKKIEMIKQGILPVPDPSQTSICYPAPHGSSPDTSFDTDSDHTYIQPDDVSEEDSFVTVSGASSRSGTPSLLEELRDLCQATPLKGMCVSSWLSDATPPKPASGERTDSTGKKGRRRKTDISGTERPGLNHYNLRRRSLQSYGQNPMLGRESPRSFARKVQQLAERTIQRNTLDQTYSVERRSGDGLE